VHADPINNVDPSGMMDFKLEGQLMVTKIQNMMASMMARTTLFALGHPLLVTTFGFLLDIAMPEEFNQAMIGTGIPSFSEVGEIGLAGKGFCRTIFAAKSPWFRNMMKRLDKSISGKIGKELGDVFEEFFSKYLPNASRDVPTVGKNTIDYVWNTLAIEIKTTTGYFGKEQKKQLKSAGAYAKREGKKLLYFFLEKPPQAVEDAIKNEGGTPIYFYERGQ
jgi:hypothetical protein